MSPDPAVMASLPTEKLKDTGLPAPKPVQHPLHPAPTPHHAMPGLLSNHGIFSLPGSSAATALLIQRTNEEEKWLARQRRLRQEKEDRQSQVSEFRQQVLEQHLDMGRPAVPTEAEHRPESARWAPGARARWGAAPGGGGDSVLTLGFVHSQHFPSTCGPPSVLLSFLTWCFLSSSVPILPVRKQRRRRARRCSEAPRPRVTWLPSPRPERAFPRSPAAPTRGHLWHLKRAFEPKLFLTIRGGDAFNYLNKNYLYYFCYKTKCHFPDPL